MATSAEALPQEAIKATQDDPFARVLAQDDRSEQRFLLCLALTLALHVGAAAQGLARMTGLHSFAQSVHQALDRQRRLEIEIEEPPPPPPPEPEPEAPPEPEPPKEAPPPVKAIAPTPAAPPAAAEAGKVLAADPDPDEPLDLTGDGFVQGTGDTYAGGVTSSTGTSRTAVRDLNASGAGTPAPVAAKVVAAPTVDRSRAASPLSGSWDHCGFPAEADIEQVNYARVSLAVTISADGRAQNATVVKDPGYGFGALARRCAMKERFSPALGKDGAPITATQVITINFRR